MVVKIKPSQFRSSDSRLGLILGVGGLHTALSVRERALWPQKRWSCQYKIARKEDKHLVVSEWIPFLMSGINHPFPPLPPFPGAAPPEKSDEF